ncbi:MAG: ACP S-malonyltransferase [Desulfomonile tiedjei]|uniref:Malonyl CoA-acyl carrier protein transacylase n=1 Tax=Desulfomonile tiedjei TaxID=2358 RepID=A0A9D6V3N7_9BACT|nr:ACP S-malonyltransferase [Desulfomonile tiedjei]
MTTPAIPQEHGSVALIFPGQGSQFAGMAKDLAEESATARALLERADDILGYSLSRIMAGERGDELNRTVHTQPAVFVHSMALLEVLRERHPLNPVMAAGHSLGEYSALCAAGVLDFDEALDTIRVRAEGMDNAQPPGTCAMAALLGPSREEALKIVETHRGDHVLEAANFNAPDQVVVSGHLEAVGRLVEAVKNEKRTRAVMLPVSSAFHTTLMEPAREALVARLERVVLGNASFPVIANVNAKPYPDSAHGVKQRLTAQLVSPVLWEDCVRTMRANGVELFLEVGPGKVLTGLMKRIERTVSAASIADLAGISSLGAQL